MEKRTISGELNEVYEGLMLLIHSSEKEYARMEKEYIRKHAKPSDKVIEKYELLKKMEAEFREKAVSLKEELRFYFQKEQSNERCLGQLVFLANENHKQFRTIEELQAHWKTLTENAYNLEFSEQLYMYQSTIFDDDFISQQRELHSTDIMKQILSMNIPDEEKMRLQDVYLFPDKHRDKLVCLLENAISVIKGHEAELNSYAKEFEAYWTQKLKEISIEAYFHEKLGIGLDKNEFGFVIGPHFFSPCTISISAENEGEKILGPYQIGMGFLFDDEFEPSVKQEKEDDVQKYLENLKLLCDQSKFAILEYIKDKKAYGGELAKQFELTPATISHHMSALLGAGLVKIEKENTRIYYSADKEAIAGLLEFCEKTLL